MQSPKYSSSRVFKVLVCLTLQDLLQELGTEDHGMVLLFEANNIPFMQIIACSVPQNDQIYIN